MATTADPDGEEALMDRAGHGDEGARSQLLERHRDRLKRVVAVRMDRRLAARVDASDLVQEAMTDAVAGLDDYLARRPLPLFAWLRQFAWNRLIDAHRRHVLAGRRSVTREQAGSPPVADESVADLAGRLVGDATSPSRGAMRGELREKVRSALDRLPERDREILVLRHLEQLDNAEIAAVLGLSQGAVRTRQVRALGRLRDLLGDHTSGGLS